MKVELSHQNGEDRFQLSSVTLSRNVGGKGITEVWYKSQLESKNTLITLSIQHCCTVYLLKSMLTVHIRVKM